MYAYCNNNPVMYVDPEGENIWIGILIGSVVGFLLSLWFTGMDSNDSMSDEAFDNGKRPQSPADGLHERFLYYDYEVDEFFDVVISESIEIGVDKLEGVIDNNSGAGMSALSASAQIGYLGVGAELILGSLFYSRTFDIFGETIVITLSANIGVGGGAFIADKEFGFSATCGAGFSLSIGFGGN